MERYSDRLFREAKCASNNHEAIFRLQRYWQRQEAERLKRALRILKEEPVAKIRYCCLLFAEGKCLRCKKLGFPQQFIHVPDDPRLGTRDPWGYELDHVIDRKFGGRLEWTNVQPLHRFCNQLKRIAREQGDERREAWDFRDGDPVFMARCNQQVEAYRQKRAEASRQRWLHFQ